MEQLIRVLTYYYAKQHYASREGRPVTICSRRYVLHVNEVAGATELPDCGQCVRIAAREGLAVSP